MGSLWKHTWSRVTVLGVAVLAVVTAVVVYSTRGGERPKVDRAQLRKACAGLLPTAHLASLLPDDSAMRRKQYGTLLEPGHESRALIDCRLDWNGEGERGDVGVHIRAEPWGPDDELPSGGDVFPFPYRLPHGFRGAVVMHDMYGDVVNAEALLQVACPKGDFERFRLGTDLKVSVELPVHVDDEDDGEEYTDELVEEDLRLTARSAARVADWVSERHSCGTAPLGVPSRAPEPDDLDDSDDPDGPDDPGDKEAEPGESDVRGPRGTGVCAWLDPVDMGYPQGLWEVSGSPSFDSVRGECRARLDDPPEEIEVRGVSAVSVSGVGARRFHQRGRIGPGDHGTGEHGPGPGWATVRKGTAELLPNSAHALPSLALWAESVCDEGQTFHRVSITPELGYHLDADGRVTRHDEEGPALDEAAREKLSRTVRAALDRYLAAPGGWPERAHCRDTTILGEVEEWRSADDE